MRVVVLTNLAGSLINFRGPLLQAMVDRGHEVVACGPGHDLALVERLSALGVSYRNVPLGRTGMNPNQDLKTLTALRQLFLELSPDLFFGYTIKPVIYGSLAARWAGVRHIYSMVTGLGYAFSKGTLKQQLVNLAARTLYRTSLASNDKVFFQNPDDRDLFVKLGLVKPGQAVLVNGSGVDLAHFCPAPLPPPPTFLLIARLIEDKGILVYAEAARRIKQRYPEARFHLLGPFDTNPNSISRTQVEAWEDEGVITYLGKTRDVRPFMREATVYVLPSHYREGTPRTILEAMAMGRPIITTDAPGCRETVIDGENGFLIPTKDVTSLTKAIEKFLEQPDLVAQMGRRSRGIAEQKYDVHKVNAVMLQTMGLDARVLS